MSGSLTVVGGVNSSTITGLVTVPAVLPSNSVLNNLQAFLSNTVSGAVTGGGANFQNLNAAGLLGDENGSITVGSGAAGLLEVTNTNADGSISQGQASVNFNVPEGYNYLVVQAPGFETVSGNNATNFLATFGSLSGVTFNTGGAGTVAALGPNDYVGLINGAWSVLATGGDTVNTSAATSTISTFGTSNVVGLLGGTSTVQAGGTKDLIETFNAGVSAVVTVTGTSDNILVDGGSDTVFANAGQSGVNAFFNASGGSLYFVNNSSVVASVTGGVSGAIGGAVTAFGGTGGGYYVGGPGGNNSLVGGTGVVTLIGAGTGNFLAANGSVGGGNDLQVGTAGTSTLVASSSTGANQFVGGTAGTALISTSGAGQQNFFIGNGDTETITGSTTAGAQNIYHFEAPSTGSGVDIITNFTVSGSAAHGSNYLLVDEQGSYAGQVSIASAETVGGGQGGTQIQLSDSTTIKLIGTYLTQSQITSIVGSNSI